jgi:hypothetical protein
MPHMQVVFLGLLTQQIHTTRLATCCLHDQHGSKAGEADGKDLCAFLLVKPKSGGLAAAAHHARFRPSSTCSWWAAFV